MTACLLNSKKMVPNSLHAQGVDLSKSSVGDVSVEPCRCYWFPLETMYEGTYCSIPLVVTRIREILLSGHVTLAHYQARNEPFR